MKNWRVALPRVRKMPVKRRLCNPNVARTSSQARNPSLPPLAFARRISDCFIFVSIPNSVQKSPMTWECSAIALPRDTNAELRRLRRGPSHPRPRTTAPRVEHLTSRRDFTTTYTIVWGFSQTFYLPKRYVARSKGRGFRPFSFKARDFA